MLTTGERRTWRILSGRFAATLVALTGACASRPDITPQPSNPSVATMRDQLGSERELPQMAVVGWARPGLMLRIPNFISHGSSDTGAYWYGRVIVQAFLRRLPMSLKPPSWSCRQVTDCIGIGGFVIDSVNHVVVGSATGGGHSGASRAARMMPCDDTWYLELDVFDPKPQSSVPLDVVNSASVTGMGICDSSGSLDEPTGTSGRVN